MVRINVDEMLRRLDDFHVSQTLTSVIGLIVVGDLVLYIRWHSIMKDCGCMASRSMGVCKLV